MHSFSLPCDPFYTRFFILSLKVWVSKKNPETKVCVCGKKGGEAVFTEYLWVALKGSQQWAPQISPESSHLIYSPAKALKLHPLQLFHTHHPTFSTSPTLISFLRNASLHCVHQTLMSAVHGSAKCTGEHKGPCSWEADMPVLFLSHLSVLQAPLNVCETQIAGPPH